MAWATFAWRATFTGAGLICVWGNFAGRANLIVDNAYGARLIFAWVTFCVSGLILRGVAFTGAELMFAGNVWECG